MNLAAVALAALAALAPLRKAPTPEEARLFTEGLDAYGRGDPGAAEKAWKAGYEIARDPAFLVRIGEAQEKAGAPALALESYRRYLREAADASDRADIEARIGRLAPAASPLASDEPSPAGVPTTVPLTPAAPAAAQVGDTGDAPAGPPEAPRRSRLNLAAWTSVGLATAALGVTAFFAASGAEANGDVNRLVNYREDRTGRPSEYDDVADQYEDAVRRGERANRNTRIALGVTGGLVGLAALLFVVDSATAEPSESVRLGWAPAPGGGSVSAGWRF